MKNYKIGISEKAMKKNLSIIEMLKVAKDTGYDYLELVATKDFSLSDDEILKILSYQIKENIYVGTITFKENLSLLKDLARVIRIGSKLGVRFIQIEGYRSNEISLDDKQKYVDDLKKAVLIAAYNKMTLALSVTEEKSMDTVTEALYFLAKIRNPYLQLYPNLGNLANAAFMRKSDSVADMRRGEGHIVAAQIKETLPHVYQNLKFGEGHTNLNRCIAELVKQGVFTYTVEVFYDYSETWEEAIINAYKFVHQKLESVWEVRYGKSSI